MKVLDIIDLDYSNSVTTEFELAQTEKNLVFDLSGNLFSIWVLTAESIETSSMRRHIK